MRVPWTAGGSNQSILKEISPGCSLEGLMLKLKLQYFGHLMQRADSFEKTLMLGKTEGRRRRERQRMRRLDGITDSVDMSLSKVWEIEKGSLACCSLWGHKELDKTEVTEHSNTHGSFIPSFLRNLHIVLLKLQYFGHLMQRANSFEKTLMPRKIECRRRRG